MSSGRSIILAFATVALMLLVSFGTMQAEDVRFNPEFEVIIVDETLRNDRRDGFEPHIVAGPGEGGEGEWYYYDSPSGLLSPGVSMTRRPGNVWISKDHGLTWEFKEKKNAITDNLPPGIGGSGDTHIAVSSGGGLFHTDLYLASASVDMSLDGGDNWYFNPVASNYVLDDRQWLDIGPTKDGTPSDETVYFCFNQLFPLGLVMTKAPVYSGGAVDNYLWTPCNNGLPITTDVSARDNFCVDEESGTIYITNYAPGAGQIEVWKSTDGGDSFTQHPVFSASSRALVQNIFTVIDTDIEGNIYITFSSRTHMWMAVSTDEAETWTLHQVTTTESVKALPWLAAGGDGMVGMAWYEAEEGTSGTPDQQSESWWDVNVALCYDGTAEEPEFHIFTVDEAVHFGGVQTTGTGGGSDRDLGDYLSVDIDSHGRFLVSYGEDGDDGNNARLSYPMYAGQMEGPFLRENVGPELNYQLKKDGEKVSLNFEGTRDLEDLDIVNITVDWGDGTGIETLDGEMEASHVYLIEGKYEMVLRASNELRMQDSETKSIEVGSGDDAWEIAGISGWALVGSSLLLLLGVLAAVFLKKKETPAALPFEDSGMPEDAQPIQDAVPAGKDAVPTGEDSSLAGKDAIPVEDDPGGTGGIEEISPSDGEEPGTEDGPSPKEPVS